MKLLILFAAGAIASAPAAALASIHPEEEYPDDAPVLTEGGQFAELLSAVQEALHQQGFDAGPVNGAFSSKTQAALVQFQLSRLLPASGMLDDATLRELGVAAR